MKSIKQSSSFFFSLTCCPVHSPYLFFSLSLSLFVYKLHLDFFFAQQPDPCNSSVSVPTALELSCKLCRGMPHHFRQNVLWSAQRSTRVCREMLKGVCVRWQVPSHLLLQGMPDIHTASGISWLHMSNVSESTPQSWHVLHLLGLGICPMTAFKVAARERLCSPPCCLK